MTVTTPALRPRTAHAALPPLPAAVAAATAAGREPAALVGDATRLPLPDARAWGALFAGPALSACQAERLAPLARVRRLTAGQAVFRQGEPACSLVALLQGDAALGRMDAQGQFRTERHLCGPAWLDASAAWLGAPRAHDARALGAATLLEFDADDLAEALEQAPGLATQFVRVLASEVRTLTRHAQALMHQDAPARWAGWLQAHCQDVPGAPERGLVQLTLRKRDIASQLAITPETLSRLMRSFTSQGVIEVAGYTVHVLDRARLAALAAG